MRDRLIHGYFGVNYEIVWDVVTNKLWELAQTVKQMLNGEMSGQIRRLVRVRDFEPLDELRIRIEFEDWAAQETDLKPYCTDSFSSVKVEGCTVVWDTGADLYPDVLYYA